MSKEADNTGLLKIGELAKAAGLSVSTVKYYVKEGLVAPSCKTGPNMAYYSPDCVDRIRLIKTLQKERFYPLSVIRELLTSGTDVEHEMGLLDAIHKVSRESDGGSITASEAVKRTGLSRSDIAALTDAGVVKAEKIGKRTSYAESELRVMELVRRRMDAGMTLGQTATAFQSYETALQNAARQDIDALVGELLLRRDLTTESTEHLIRVSDETLDDFIALRRAEANRRYGSLLLEELADFAGRLSAGQERLRRALWETGLNRAAELCMAGVSGENQEQSSLGGTLYAYELLPKTADNDTVQRIMACGRALNWFTAEHEISGDAMAELLRRALVWLWFKAAPDYLRCEETRSEAETALTDAAENLLSDKAALFLAALKRE